MLGDGPTVLNALAAGDHPWSAVLRGAKNPMIVVGQGALARPDGARVLGIITPIENEPACSNAACHAHPTGQRPDDTRELVGLEPGLYAVAGGRDVPGRGPSRRRVARCATSPVPAAPARPPGTWCSLPTARRAVAAPASLEPMRGVVAAAAAWPMAPTL